jgi:hypothetical protein
VAKPGSIPSGQVGDQARVAAPAQLRLVARPIAANDNRAPLARRLLRPTMVVLALAALSCGAYLIF